MIRPPALAVATLLAATAAAEVPPPAPAPCFPGAYYRKAVSSVDQWTGIEGVVVLPTIHFDQERLHPTTRRPLDNASIYLGGHATIEGDPEGQEIDAGLTWEVIRRADGTVSPQREAFRPFWRNKQWFNAPARPEFYYYPGDTIRLRCALAGDDQLELEVTVLARAATSPSQELSTFTTTFAAPGWRPGRALEFKRVNAIDQFGNEGRGVSETKTSITGAEWLWVDLLRAPDNERRPFTPARFADMRCPDPAHIRVAPGTAPEKGGERIDLVGAPAGGAE